LTNIKIIYRRQDRKQKTRRMMTKEEYPQFHQAEVFRDLPEKERQRLLIESISRKLTKGQFLVHQEEIWPYVIYVHSGQLRWAMLSTSGKEHTLFTINPTQTFWAHSIFDNKPMPASLMATKRTDVLLWDHDTILRYLRRYPDVMWEITGLLTGIMRQAREIIYNLAFKQVAGRLASLLLDHYANQANPALERNFTLNDLASTVAASPEVVCRVLYNFQEDGILEVTRASITIHDIEALKNAQGD
jgi:CRP-like cAMP-binding protein